MPMTTPSNSSRALIRKRARQPANAQTTARIQKKNINHQAWRYPAGGGWGGGGVGWGWGVGGGGGGVGGGWGWGGGGGGGGGVVRGVEGRSGVWWGGWCVWWVVLGRGDGWDVWGGYCVGLWVGVCKVGLWCLWNWRVSELLGGYKVLVANSAAKLWRTRHVGSTIRWM
jgi:hypothetical protein